MHACFKRMCWPLGVSLLLCPSTGKSAGWYRNERSRKRVSELKVTHLCQTLCNPMDYTVHGVLQARILEWVAIPFSRDLPNPRIEPRSPTLRVDSLPAEPPGKPKNTGVGSLSLFQRIFPTQDLNWDLLHARQTLYQLSYEGCP